ncbi:MAG: YafY family transcriptional regulator [Chloroflexi bacterium]|nr:YafY family transcriptional regulator [Chloroflexota bacterium]
MRADRLVSIVLLLQSRGQLTASELARRLEVSERTIYRDMEALSAAGIPVYAERGRGGGCRLVEGYRTSLTGLSVAEIRSLFLGQSSGLLSDLGLREAAEAALLKLMVSLPELARRDAEYARQRVHVDTAGWNRREERVPHLQALQEAVWDDRRVRLTYRRNDGALVEREVDPLGLVAKASAWYLVGSVAGQLRTFRVSRVESVVVLDEICTRPEGFDLATHWSEHCVQFVAALPRYPVRLRVAPEALPLLYPSGYVKIERIEPAGTDGWHEASLTFEIEEDACGYVLRLSALAEVVEPARLRARVLELVESVGAWYRRDGVMAEAPVTADVADGGQEGVEMPTSRLSAVGAGASA